ncbi:MAG: hypothetical protein ACFHVJ_16410 [Aestuariibacter sp.]
MKHPINIILMTILFVTSINSKDCSAQQPNSWDNAYNAKTKQRFIPVELFTGANWDGKHQLNLNKVTTTACYTVIGRNRPCDKVHLSGPFLTEANNTKIEWAEDKVPYYVRKFKIRGEQVESHFTINNSRDGMVRIFDKRKRWGNRAFDGLGSKFPLGYWKQGEVRTYPSKRPTKIEILELNGPEHCLTFRWIVNDGEKRNQDNNYTFCPNRGFTAYESNYKKNS